jgi:hypothetical protein
VLRHQLAILRRGGKRPQYTTVDQALLAAVSRLLPPERWSCFAVSPQTLRRWHRTLRERGRRRCRRRPGRPPLAAETRGLIRRLARENPRWGYVRIQGELLKLGIGVSATTIATVLRSSGLGPAPRRIGPSWSQFLRSQAHSMVGGSSSPAPETTTSETMRPSRAGRPRLGRTATWRLATTSPRRMPSSHVQPLIQSGAGRRRRGRAVSMRPQGHCGCRRRIDRMLATDPKEQARALVYSQVLGLGRDVKASRPGRRSPPTAYRIPGGFRESSARDVGATDRPPARAARPNRVSLPHSLSRWATVTSWRSS